MHLQGRMILRMLDAWTCSPSSCRRCAIWRVTLFAGHQQSECPKKAIDVYRLPDQLQGKVDEMYAKVASCFLNWHG
jgi:hypothetical protein